MIIYMKSFDGMHEVWAKKSAITAIKKCRHGDSYYWQVHGVGFTCHVAYEELPKELMNLTESK